MYAVDEGKETKEQFGVSWG